MSEMVCIAFSGKDTADKVLTHLRELEKEYLVDLEDACIVVRDEKGKIHIKQAVPLAGVGAAQGGTWGMLWGTLIGLIFLNPLAGLITGAVVGAGAGALSGALSDYGIDDKFIKDLGSTIQSDSSALFVLFRKITADKVLPDLAHFGGTVLKTSLSTEDEDKLKAALAEHA